MLWYPDIPDPRFCFKSHESSGEDSAISLAIFGGSQGQDLRYIVDLTVWVRSSCNKGF
jgi:hypothetical protein